MTVPTLSDWATQWQWSWVGVALALGLTALFLGRWTADSARSPGRLAAFVGSLTGLLYLTCGPLGVFSSTWLWAFGLRVALLNAVIPLGLALSFSLDVGSSPGRGTGLHRVARTVARILAFPAVSSVLAAVSVLAVFLTPYGEAASRSAVVDAVLVTHLLVVGLLVVVPLLSEGLLPRWATPGPRTLIAALDGLVDALPGIVVMTSGHLLLRDFSGFTGAHRSVDPLLDQRLAGGLLLAVAEAVGIPMLIACFVQWMRHDEARAQQVDRELDAARSEGESSTPWWLTENDGSP